MAANDYTAGSALSGFTDFFGTAIDKLGPIATTIYTTKAQADAAKAQAKAQAESAASAPKTPVPAAAASGGGFPPPYVLYGVGGAVGRGVIIWAATRKG